MTAMILLYVNNIIFMVSEKIKHEEKKGREIKAVWPDDAPVIPPKVLKAERLLGSLPGNGFGHS